MFRIRGLLCWSDILRVLALVIRVIQLSFLDYLLGRYDATVWDRLLVARVPFRSLCLSLRWGMLLDCFNALVELLVTTWVLLWESAPNRLGCASFTSLKLLGLVETACLSKVALWVPSTGCTDWDRQMTFTLGLKDRVELLLWEFNIGWKTLLNELSEVLVLITLNFAVLSILRWM